MAKKKAVRVVNKRKEAALRKDIKPPPNWDLYRDGISYSMLSRFIVDPERFRLYAVEGMRQQGTSKASLDFGTYMHSIMELHARMPHADYQTLMRRNPHKLREHWPLVAEVMTDRYLWYYANCSYTYLKAEEVFDVPLKLPNGKTIRLRGRSDELVKGSRGKIKIQENKTADDINRHKIESFLPYNLQTMFYATAVEIKHKRKVEEIIYNVIRKPRHKPSKKGKRHETPEEYMARLDALVEDNPEHFFYRLEFPMAPQHLLRWQHRTLYPLLTQLCIWWDSIKHNPFDPWVQENGELNPHHYMRPFGVYDSLTLGIGDFFDVITRGNYNSVITNQDPFEELNEDVPRSVDT